MPARSDKLHHRRKTARSLKRRPATLNPKKRVLIVCEGEVTEVDYFERYRSKSSLSNVDLEVCGKECGSSPSQVVSFALERSKAEGPQDLGGYDNVYCVFDRDEHNDFEKAKSLVLSASKPQSSFKGGSIEAIWSVPCFEVWLVMHFSDTRAPYSASQGKTVGQSVCRFLRSFAPFKDYEKSLMSEQLEELEARHLTAIENAQAAYEDFEKTGEPNPSTKIHFLMAALDGLR